MCGIAGVLRFDGNPPGTIPCIEKMLTKISHRGPDEWGIYNDDNISMGSARLSILDIETGQQPLSSPEDDYWIVYNGEIFNYIELKKSLEKAGHVFHTKSDTEVLLHSYLQYGSDCLNRLNGQFAFAIWNRTRRELFLARDRLGVRPLYYTWQESTFVFASEIKSITAYGNIKLSFDYKALSQVLLLWTTISPFTVFKDIFELPPGHFMVINPEGKEIHRWWQLTFPSAGRYFGGSLNEACEELDFLLRDAISLRLKADVTVAAYLSGGLDSTTTTAFIKELSPENLRTFSIGFEESEFDETSFQNEVAAYFNTEHSSFSFCSQDICDNMPLITWHTETPILRTAPVPMLCLSRKVRDNKIKVIITGEGADEMFAGYDIFKEAIIRDFWSKDPKSILRPKLFQKLYPYLAQFSNRNKEILRLFFGYKLSDTSSPFYSHLVRWHNSGQIKNYLSEDFRHFMDAYDPVRDLIPYLPDGFDSWDRLGKAQWLEIVLFMSGYLLSSQGDRVSMANSVEGRFPFLDHRVVEFAASLPPDFKMHGLREKHILKTMMKGRIPDSVINRDKQAYRAPGAGHLFDGKGADYLDQIISSEALQETGVFEPKVFQKLTAKAKTGNLITETDNMILSSVISTQLIHKQFISFENSGLRPESDFQGEIKRIIDYSKT
jgi:asparagine synthase (glutamine-hydrolysing)